MSVQRKPNKTQIYDVQMQEKGPFWHELTHGIYTSEKNRDKLSEFFYGRQ